MEIDYDYLRTGTAIGFRASYELFSNYLFIFGLHVVSQIKDPNIIDGNLKTDHQVLISPGVHISDTAGHQMT